MAEGGLKFDFSGLLNESKKGLNTAASGAIASVSTPLFGPEIKTDQRGFQTARSAGNYMGKHALQGAAMGAKFGFVGAGIGAVAGAGIGLLKKKSIDKQVDRSNEMLTANYQNQLRSQGNALYFDNLSKQSNQLYKKGGCIYPKGRKMYSQGGVILGGETHDNMGNAIVDDNNQIVAETEREELLLGVRETEMINRMIEMIDSDQSEMNFAQLGQLFIQNVLPNIKDNSGKFGLNKALLSDDL